MKRRTNCKKADGTPDAKPKFKRRSSAVVVPSSVETPRFPRPERVPILIVARENMDGAGGFNVDVYGDREAVDVRIFQQLSVEGPELERLAEDYLEASLPFSHRSLFLPRNLVASDFVKPWTPEQETERQRNLAMLRAYEMMGASHG